MNVIVVGSGAREHALCRILHKSYLCEKVFCFPGNYGISQIAECKDCLLYTSPSPRDED